MTIAPDHRPLVGSHVRLDPTVPDDAEALFAVLDHDEVWAARPSVAVPRPRSAQEYRATLIADPASRLQYTVRLLDGTVVGTTSIGDVDVVNEQAHVGWTSYTPSVWGTAVNPECKYLLLRHLFEDCGMGRVRIQTDALNERSQAAIAKLGATREGVLRRHVKRADGSFRDTVVFSILADEWPRVREGLLARLG